MSEARLNPSGRSVVTERLQDLGTWVGGGTPAKGNRDYWEDGTIPWVSPKDMKNTVLEGTGDKITSAAVAGSSVKTFEPNSIAVVVRSGILSHTLPIALIPFAATANQDMRVLTPRAGLHSQWVLYALMAHAQDIRRVCSKQGTTVASIDVPKLMAYEIVVPPPELQKALAGQIEESLARLRAGIEGLDRGGKRMSNLQAAMARRLLRLEASRLPEGWRWRSLAEVADLSAGGTPPRGIPDNFGGDIPWVKIGDLTEGAITTTEETLSPKGVETSSAEILETETVLVAMYGASIGRTGLLGIRAATNQAICAMRAKEELITPHYLHRLMQANKPIFVAAGYGGAQPNISQRYLKAFQVPVPPVTVQEWILTQLAEFDTRSTETSHLIESCRLREPALRRGILSRASYRTVELSKRNG